MQFFILACRIFHEQIMWLQWRTGQDIKVIKKRYPGMWGERMLANYCWRLKRDLSEESDKEENKNKKIKKIWKKDSLQT